MAKDRLDEALTAGQPEDAKTPAGKPPPPSKEWNVSLYLSPELKSRLDHLQTEWDVNTSELVRFLLGHALEAVDKGKIKPKRETVTRVRLD